MALLLLRPYAARRSESSRIHFDHSSVLFNIVRRNTFTAALAHDIIKAYDLFDRDDRVRVVVLTAEHTAPAFCAGVGSIPVHYTVQRDSCIYAHEIGRPQRRLDGHVPPGGSEGG